jgi:non-ribosomal peptide synthetase-like protein
MSTGFDQGTRPIGAFGRVANLVLTSGDADQSVRWTPGERLHHLFEERCDRFRAEGDTGHLAVAGQDLAVTYPELDARANRMARFLRSQGVGPGARVGLVFDEPLQSYIAILAVLKINAAYVPLDPVFPADRIAYIVGDAGVTVVLTLSHLRERVGGPGAAVVCVDEVQGQVDAQDPSRLSAVEQGTPVEDLCYVIYTSGTTGRPKGVAIEHSSICNFVRVASEVYGVVPEDRMYQGMTIAFDFSVEEIWISLVVGATLVPKRGGSLLGEDLADFLREERVTAMCCVPTLLATMDDDLPDLQFLLVSGEACPQDLVTRWHRPGRRFLNVYGPTEATVTATWTTLEPDQPVTIGVPLPTYSVVILDENDQRPLPPGQLGEIGIAGIGLSAGYVGRDDLTAKAFIPDVLRIPNNTSGLIYRSGDLGRITQDGLVECLGRIDTQVKVRGYRIELTEIESLLLQLPEIAQAVVDTFEPAPGVVELVAYYTLRRQEQPADIDLVHDELRRRLPSYMVPAYFEQLERIPMLPSDKADRKNLPAPRGPRYTAAQGEVVEAEGEVETLLAGTIAGMLSLDGVSVESNLFEDLGMNSLLIAQMSAKLRVHEQLPPIAMKDVYLNPTVRALAATLQDAAPRQASPEPRTIRRAGTVPYVLTGVLQTAAYVGFAYLVALAGVTAYGWLSDATGLLDIYLRSVALGGAVFLALTLLPVAAKWVLIGRWKPGVIPIWGLRYLRFWIVRQLLRISPALAFVGSPLYLVYLRMLGTKVGKGAVVLSTALPVCSDLITIGAGAVVRKDSYFSGYHAESGWIRTGRVDIGANALIGEATVLEIDTAVGDGAQLGHTSALRMGQRVPPGKRFHGSPAQETTADYRRVESQGGSRVRRFSYGASQLLAMLLIWAPLSTGLLFVALPSIFPTVNTASAVQAVMDGTDRSVFTQPRFYVEYFLVSGALLLGVMLLGLVAAAVVPRVLNLVVPADTVHGLYGFRYTAHRALRRLTNIQFFTNLLGDSSFIIRYLQLIGYDLSTVQQTGSNFGLMVKHESPFLSHVGTGTLVSDGLSLANADYSNSSFMVSRVSLGSSSFVGNAVTYPAGGRTGDNTLLATKAMIPVDGPVREGVGLLGSPPFEIPRSVQRDMDLEWYRSPEELPARLARKNRSNAITIAVFLLQRWLQWFGVVLIGLLSSYFYSDIGISAYALGIIAALVFTTLFSVLAERASIGFRRLRPEFCSIYQPYFWRHERLWKLSGTNYLQIFNGTPFKSIVWRMLGVRVGKKLFDDGAGIPEKTLVTIGDYCTLGAQATIQCHSLEDGSFKSGYTVIGHGSTVGANAWVHYGVTMGERVVVDADSFLMKGEEPVADSRWRGNPAREVPEGDVLVVPPTARRLARKNAREDREAARLVAWQARHGRHARARNSGPARCCPATRTPAATTAAHAEEPRVRRRRRSETQAAETGAQETRTVAHRRWRRS